MNKKFIVFLLLILSPSFLVAQESIDEQQELDQIKKQQNKFFIAHVKVDVNNVFLNNVNYIETKIAPFFKIENFYLALEFPLKIATDNGGILNSWDYIYPNNYLQFIQTIGYFMPDRSFQVKIGTLTDISLGDGLLMSNFRNDLFLPNIRHLGLFSKGEWKYGGFYFFTSNIENFGLTGGGIFVKPFKGLDTTSLFKETKLYGNFIYDGDTLHILMNTPDKINLKRNPHSGANYAYSVGLTSPFYKSLDESLILSAAIEQATILSGHQYGILGKFSLQYNFYTLDLGLAYLKNGFHFNFFSPLYLQPRIRETRASDLHKGNSLGYQISNKLSFFNQNLNFYLDIYGQSDPLMSYHLSLELKPYILGQLSLLISYIAEDIDSLSGLVAFDSLKVNNFIATQIAYRFADNTQIAFFYRRAVKVATKNTKIEPSNEISVKVSIIF